MLWHENAYVDSVLYGEPDFSRKSRVREKQQGREQGRRAAGQNAESRLSSFYLTMPIAFPDPPLTTLYIPYPVNIM